MRKLISLTALLVFLFAFTCENEPIGEDVNLEDTQTPTDPTDPTSPPEDFSFVGEWELVEFTSAVSTVITSDNLPIPPVESDFQISSTTVDYTIIFTESDFSASGSYAYNVTAIVDGQQSPTEEQGVTDVSGDGTYTVSGNEFTTEGQLFELTFEGMEEIADFDEPQTSTFTVSPDGNTVTFSGSTETSQTDFGITSEVNSTSTSVMQRVD